MPGFVEEGQTITGDWSSGGTILRREAKEKWKTYIARHKIPPKIPKKKNSKFQKFKIPKIQKKKTPKIQNSAVEARIRGGVDYDNDRGGPMQDSPRGPPGQTSGWRAQARPEG